MQNQNHTQVVQDLLAWLEDNVSMETPIHFDNEGLVKSEQALAGLENLIGQLKNAQKCLGHILDANGDLDAMDFAWVRSIASPRSDNGTDQYLLVMEGDVEPDLRGPFPDDDERLSAAKAYRKYESDDDVLYRIDVPTGTPLYVTTFTGGELSAG